MNLVIFFEASSGHFGWIFDRKVWEEAWIFRPFPGPFCCEVWKRSDVIFSEKVAPMLEPFISKQGFLPCPFIRELKMETFSGRRQLQPDVTSWFVPYCACSCSPHCRRAPVGDVKLVCLVLWREHEYLLSFQSGFLRLATRILQIIVLKLSLFSLSHISSSISKLCHLNLHLYNVSMFHITESRSSLIQYGTSKP